MSKRRTRWKWEPTFRKVDLSCRLEKWKSPCRNVGSRFYLVIVSLIKWHAAIRRRLCGCHFISPSFFSRISILALGRLWDLGCDDPLSKTSCFMLRLYWCTPVHNFVAGNSKEATDKQTYEMQAVIKSDRHKHINLIMNALKKFIQLLNKYHVLWQIQHRASYCNDEGLREDRRVIEKYVGT